MNRANYFKIGLFIMTSLTLIVAGIVVLGAGAFFQDYILMETYIDESVQGLDIGSPIKHRGVKIGEVSSINFVRNVYLDRFTTQEDQFRIGRYVLIRCELKPGVFGNRPRDEVERLIQRAIEGGMRVRLASQGLTGVAYLEVDYLDPKQNPVPKISWEPDVYYLPSAPSTISRLFENVETVLLDLGKAGIGEIGVKVQDLLDVLERKIDQVDLSEIRGGASSLLAELRTTNEQLQRLLTNPELEGLVKDSSASVKKLRRILEDSEEEIETILGDVSSISTDMKGVVSHLPGTLSRLDRELRRFDEILADNTSDLTETIGNLREFSRDLKELVANAKKYPAQILFGEPPPPVETSRPRD